MDSLENENESPTSVEDDTKELNLLISSIPSDIEIEKLKRNVSFTDELDKLLKKKKAQAVKSVIPKCISQSQTQTIKSSQIKNLYFSNVENN
jgi:hypothetical protein